MATESYETTIKRLDNKVKVYEDSIASLEDQNHHLRYFTVYNKEDALSYFEKRGFKISTVLPLIEEELYKLNNYNGEEHPLIPYVSMTDNKMLINKVSIVNHRWILTDFTDGKHWGELFLTYEITEEGELKFRLGDYLMFSPN